MTINYQEQIYYNHATALRVNRRVDWHTAEDWAQEATIATWQAECRGLAKELCYKAARFRIGALNSTATPARQLGGMSVRFDRNHRSHDGVAPVELAEPSVEEDLAAGWEKEALLQAIEELPPRLRNYIKRRFWKGAEKRPELERPALELLRQKLTTN